MEILKETRFVERLQFFNGQRLFASDLQGLEAFNREMRWLHNKSLHQPGIGNGFAVAGKKGDREVQIGPGYAIDALGREIVLTQSQVEPVPPVGGEEDGSPTFFDLTVSYPDDRFLEETETRVGICSGPGVVRLKEEPVFCWVKLNENQQPEDDQIKQDILNGMRIILARAEVLNCQLNSDLSIAQRLNARPAKQPYVCCRTARFDWSPWSLAGFDVAKADGAALSKLVTDGFAFVLPVGLQGNVDTSECGFLTTPCYSARIVGPRVKHFVGFTPTDPPPDGGPVILARTVDLPFIVDGLLQIVDPQPNWFTVNVLVIIQALIQSGFSTGGNSLSAASPAAAVSGASDTDKLVEAVIKQYFSDWYVEWMGVEG